ncbi:asialoglycoprotein receptor 1-like [Mobula hypostoma]|uniref:asialoglycoprotein receptor 1-like n=1 Tax=Mobula hypostoma TaxID=723540 RepID=UPI002FC2D26E
MGKRGRASEAPATSRERCARVRLAKQEPAGAMQISRTIEALWSDTAPASPPPPNLSTPASSDNGRFPFLGSETQRIGDRMDNSETYMNVKFAKTDSRSPSQDEPDVSYVEINFQRLSEPRPQAAGDGLTSTYSELNFRKEEPLIVPPIASGPEGMSNTALTGAHEQESKLKIGNRPIRLICLLCLVTSALIVTVIRLSIHVSQIRQSKITSDRNYYELNSTLQSKISEISHLNLSQRTCLKNLSTLNSDLSVIKRMHTDLRHEFNEMETKYNAVNETKTQICELLTSRREQTCPQYWTENEGRCYFISTYVKSYDGAMENCSEFDGKLLEINSYKEQNFVSTAVSSYGTYWIGKCADGNVASYLLYKMLSRPPTCSKCTSDTWSYSCGREHRFICEKSAHLYRDIHEEIKDLCHQPVGPASIM